MKKRILIILSVIAAILLIFAAVYFIRFGHIRPTFSEGRALVAKNGEVLWIDENGSPIVMTDCTKSKKLLNGLSSGDRIKLLHDGIEESYPGHTGVYYLRKISDGDISDIPKETLNELVSLGWLDKENTGFSFSLTWGCYGISSYDSLTGKLVKTTDATHPEDYVTYYRPDEAAFEKMKALLKGLDIESYPDEYDPCEGMMSSPSRTIILTVRNGNEEKTVTCEDITLGSEYAHGKGKAFLNVCDTIAGMLMSTPAWEALPDYENYYE